MNKKITARFLARQGITAALYAVLTLALQNLSYGPLQFRVSEVMTLLAFFNPEYIWGLTLGCFLAILLSPYLMDIIIGTMASFIAVYAMSKCKNIWVASIMPAIANILVAIQIVFISGEPGNFFIIATQIMLSEIIIVTIIGVPLFKIFTRNKSFVETLELNKKKI